MNSIGSQSSPITPEVWELPEMREALAAREISTVYRLLRQRGVSQRQIAAATGQSQSEVSEILKGRQVMAYDVLARISDGLGVPRGYMGLAYDEFTAVRLVGTSETPQTKESEDVKRRNFLARAATITVGANVLGPDTVAWATSPVRTPAPSRIGSTDVRQVEAATRALRSLDYQYGGGACRDAVVAQLTWGQQMLNASAPDNVRNRLYIALADLHNLAGWTSFDIGLNDSARTHFARALELARAGGSEPLVANVLYRMGRVYLHQDAADDALKIFQLGQIAAQNSGSELAVSVICANQAWAYAKLGRVDQTISVLDRAKDEFSRANLDRAQDWVKFFDETDLNAMIGTVHTALALRDPVHTKFAIPALEKAIGGYGDNMARSRTFNVGSLATNHLIDGNIGTGLKLGNQAVDLTRELKSRRAIDRLTPLGVEAEKRRNNSDAADLADVIKRMFAA